MYASIRRYKVEPGTEAEIAQRANEGFVPIISEALGFVAYYIVDAGNGVIVSVSIFRDQSGADESNTMAAMWVKRSLASLVPSPPEITAGEVTVHKTA
jgi:heme-degrading monooxygenase HmoA